MRAKHINEEQIKQLLATHPVILGKEPASIPESSHVVHCMQCELQFQVDSTLQRHEEQADQHLWEMIRIRLYQQPDQKGAGVAPFIKDKEWFLRQAIFLIEPIKESLLCPSRECLNVLKESDKKKEVRLCQNK